VERLMVTMWLQRRRDGRPFTVPVALTGTWAPTPAGIAHRDRVTFTATRSIKAGEVCGRIDWAGRLMTIDVDLGGDVRADDFVVVDVELCWEDAAPDRP
jgi:hypothetical protein